MKKTTILLITVLLTGLQIPYSLKGAIASFPNSKLEQDVLDFSLWPPKWAKAAALPSLFLMKRP